MKNYLILIFLLIAQSGFGQRAELKELCAGVQDLLNSQKPLHLEYELAIRSREDHNQEEKMQMSLYKFADKQKMKMGNVQEVIGEGKLMVVLNHMQRTIIVQEGNTGEIASNSIMEDLSLLTNSAATVKMNEKDGVVTYILGFTPDNLYTRLELSFAKKTGRLNSIYAEFSKESPQPYHSMEVKYHSWDTGWKPAPGFPAMSRYVIKSNNKYLAGSTWSHYEVFQSEQGKLKY